MARASPGMITAQATTGPAIGPRPTSSTPARRGPLAAPAGCLRLGSSLCWRLAARNNDFGLPLSDSRGLSGQVAQVVQLGATDASTANNRDLRDHRAVYWENALHADAVGFLAHGERRANSRASLR